jgi:putative ABC transport system permease protein
MEQELMTFEQWRQDVYLACRGLLRAKAFTGTAVATLAVGIAGVTVMFALIEGVLLRPLPVQEQDRLLVAWKELRSAGFTHYPFRAAEIAVLSTESQLLDSAAGVDYNGARPFVAVENDSATLVRCVFVVGDFFGVLGSEPFLGRALTREDDVSGAENVLVISHGLWRRRYGGARDVVGRSLTLRERPFKIAGVMPRGFEYPHGAEAWITAAAFTSTVADQEFAPLVDVIARLRPGATMEAAASELHGLVPQLEADAPPDAIRGLTPVVRSYEDAVVGEVRPTMLVLFGAVTLVLAVASANVANLLLMRSERRRRDIAVRTALGASRSRLARQVLVESMVLALAAGAVGLAVALGSLPALLALVPAGLPRIDSVRIDAGVIGFTMAIAFVTSALAAMAPVLSSTHVDLASHLRSGGGGIAGPAARYGRRTLVVVQVALAVAVITATGLLTRSLLRLETVDMGLDVGRLVFVELSLPHTKYSDRERQRQFLDAIVAGLEAAPGIAGATPVNTPPFSGTGGWDAPTFTVEGQRVERAASNEALNLELIHPNYFSTFRVALVRGRAFTAADAEKAPSVVIVSEDVAARIWPGEEAIGKRLKFGGPNSLQPWRTVVGVASPTRYRELKEPRATVYVPAAQLASPPHAIALRTTSPTSVVAKAARDRIHAVDPTVHVTRVARFAELLEGPLARPRFNALVIGVFGIAALFLAAIGVYAVMSADVRQRGTEIGLRVALGATPADVRRLILGEGLRLAGLGAAIGLAGAVAATRLLRGLLFEVHPLDPASMLAATLLLVGAATLASHLPARRALRVSPVVLLKAD